jgi:ABC-type branched-subunit amino acid transport system permease subunit
VYHVDKLSSTLFTHVVVNGPAMTYVPALLALLFSAPTLRITGIDSNVK